MPRYLQVEGEDVEFVDEDGNPIKGGEESLIYVDMRGNLVPEKNAKKLLKSGYIDSRTLYGYRIQKKPSNSKPSASSYNTSSSIQGYKNSYSKSKSNHSEVDLVANMKNIFAAAKNNIAVQPNIDEIEKDAEIDYRPRRDKSTYQSKNRYDYNKYNNSRSKSYNPSKYSKPVTLKPLYEHTINNHFTKEQEKEFKRQQKETLVMNDTIEELQRKLLQNKPPKEVQTYKGYASSYVKRDPKVKTSYVTKYNGNYGTNALLQAEMNLKAQREAQANPQHNNRQPKSNYNPRAHFKYI